MSQTEVISAVPETLSLEEIKSRFPNEWVLLGNPVRNERGTKIVGGIPLYHSPDKREVAYLGKEKLVGYQRFTVIYTGTFQAIRRIASLYTPQNL